jgi:anti-sigma B factor antagonist
VSTDSFPVDRGRPISVPAAIIRCSRGTGSAAMTGPREAPLGIRAAVTAGTATLVISGELDVTTTPLLSRQLAQILEGRPQRLVFDMSGVDFIDCAATRVIATTGRFLPEGRRPVIRSPSPPVRRVLELTGFAARCEIDDPSG